MALPPSPPGPFSFAPARLRLPAGHPFFEDGDVRRHLYLQGALGGGGGAAEAEAGGGPGPSELLCPAAGCGQAFSTLESCEHHYHLLHRNVCASCRRPFPSGHLLDLHILEWHDSLFQVMAEKCSMYQCLVESCAEKFKSSKDRKDHLIKIHRYPPDFRFDKPMKSKSTKTKSPPRDHTVPMDVNINCERSLEDAMEVGSSETAAGAAHQPGVEAPLALPASDTRCSRTSFIPQLASLQDHGNYGTLSHSLIYHLQCGPINPSQHLFRARSHAQLQKQKEESLSVMGQSVPHEALWSQGGIKNGEMSPPRMSSADLP